jgi:DNA polymerase-3 subunit beta
MLRAVATDGHRLALSEVPFQLGEDGEEFQIIVPRKAVLELGRLLGDGDSRVKLELSSSHIRLHSEELIFTSKLIDGKYPEYRRVIPMPSDNEFSVDRDSLRQALSRAAILSNEKYRGIRVSLSPGLMELQAHNPEQEEAEEKLAVEYQGEDLTIGFNVGYLLDVLNVMEEETVVVDLKDSNSSALILGQGNNQSRYVVMPMRL